MWFRSFFVLFIVCLGLSFKAFAKDTPVVLPAELQQAEYVGFAAQVFEDKTASLSFDEVMREASKGAFKPLGRQDLSIGTTASVWWVKFELHNPGAAKRLVLREEYALIDYLDLWLMNDVQTQQFHSGDMLPFSERLVAANSLDFILNLSADSTTTVVMRYETKGALSINLLLTDPLLLAESQSHHMLMQGIFYGALVALVLYNLFIFIIVRDVSYLLYIFYLVALGLFLSAFNGLSAQYLWPESPWWANHSLLLFWGAVIAMALIFSQHFLNMRFYSSVLNRIANGFILIALSCAIASLVLPYDQVIKVLFLLAPPSYLLILIAAFKGVRRGYAPAKYFLTAWALLMVAAILSTLISAAVIDGFSAISPYIIQYGALVEVVLLSIALASRIRTLEQDALTDALTKLFNRRFFDRQLQTSTQQAAKKGQGFVLMLIDIDYFKQFNDTHGHDTGDLALRAVADHLQKVARRSDYVCRYGGEEFAIILPGTRLDEARVLAERVRASIASVPLADSPITASIGLAELTPGMDEVELFRRADQSLYAAKEAGRDRFSVYDDLQFADQS